MKKFVYKIGAAVASVGLAATLLAPAAFAADVTISGNGDHSQNHVTISSTTTCTVVQENSTSVEADLTAKANTGGNSTNSTTGGSVTIDTGNANASASLVVMGGDNTINTSPCCPCNPTQPTVSISGNGQWSNSTVGSTKSADQTVVQGGSTDVGASLLAKAKTGKNHVSSSTGGSVKITTGAATAGVGLNVTGGTNSM